MPPHPFSMMFCWFVLSPRYESSPAASCGSWVNGTRWIWWNLKHFLFDWDGISIWIVYDYATSLFPCLNPYVLITCCLSNKPNEFKWHDWYGLCSPFAPNFVYFRSWDIPKARRRSRLVVQNPGAPGCFTHLEKREIQQWKRKKNGRFFPITPRNSES